MAIAALALLGGFLGTALAGGHWSGLWTGAALGALAGWVRSLRDRVQALEQRSREADRPPGAAAVLETEEATRTVGPSAEQPSAHSAALRTAAAARPSAEAPAAALPTSEPRPHRPAARPSAAPANPRPEPIGQAMARIQSWLTTGNVPVKVGVVLSLFGVGFLVKEAVDRNWMILPVWLRLVLVAAFGVALLGLGWRLREKHRSYALSVQGGGVGILYLTTYAALALYHLLPAAAAFALLLLVTVAVGALAVLQDARALAVLGVFGGFMAPLLTSTGAGSHVALFGYYAVLDVAIVGVAWFKAWRELNLLGFFFTFGIGSLWGYNGYRPEHFATTEPFLVLFVLMYTLIPVLFATRRPPDLKGFVDGTLLFGTPLVAFGLQAQLVGDTEYGLAISASSLAAFYLGLAIVLLRRRLPALGVLVEALFALSFVFLTIAVPLALDVRWTSVAWALQGAAAVWLGVRQRRRLALASGAALQLAAGIGHFYGDYVASYFRGAAAEAPILNGAFLGAALLAAAAWISGWLVDRGLRDGGLGDGGADGADGAARSEALSALASGFLCWGGAWWLFAGLVEIGRHAPAALELATALLFVAATALAAVLAAARIHWARLDAAGLVTLPAIVLGAPLALFAKPHPLADYGWVAWPVAFAVHAAILRMREARFPRLQPVLHALPYWALAALLADETAWQMDRVAGGAWPVAASLAATAALLLFTVRRSSTRALAVGPAGGAVHAWPFAVHRRIYLQGCAGVALAFLTFATLAANLASPGDAPPLPYVPLLNPLELASAFVALVLVAWWRAARAGLAGPPGEAGAEGAVAGRAERRGGAAARGLSAPGLASGVPALFGLFLLTMTVARTVHHWAGVPFDLELLAASTPFQAALSIVWGTAALGAMLLGARKARREIWLSGAALMAVVVAKLFLVDLGNAGTVGRVVSFLGVGVLLLVVGYFAPAPPRAAKGGRTDDGSTAAARKTQSGL